MYNHMHVLMCLFQECLFSPVLVGRYSAHAMASYAQDCPDLGPETCIFIYGSNKHKLICTGWAHLVELLRSSYKFLVPDCLGFSCLCAGITVLMLRHLHEQYCPVRWLEARISFGVIYKISKRYKNS